MTEHTSKPGWPRVRFGDVVRLNTDRSADPAADGIERYVAIEHIEPEDLRIRSWGLIAEGTTFTQRIRPGQTLFVKRRAYQRKVAVAEFDAVCSGDIYVLEPKDDRLLPELLPFLCQTDAFFEHAVNTSAGSLSPRTNWTQLAQYEFALPPLAEQRRIATLLTSIDEMLDSMNDLLRASKTTADSLFGELIDREQSSQICALADLCEFITDGDHNPPKRKPEGIPHLVVNNINEGRIVEEGCTFISTTDYERVSKRYSPAGGDIIITCVGTIGRIALVPDNYVFSADRSLAICRPKKQLLIPEYGVWLLSSQGALHELLRMSVGTAQMHLYLGEIRQVKVKLPDVAAQERHLAKLEQFNKCRESLLARIANFSKLRQAVVSMEF